MLRIKVEDSGSVQWREYKGTCEVDGYEEGQVEVRVPAKKC
jgi:hypothetical protein